MTTNTKLTTLSLNITSSEFVCSKLQDSLTRSCEFFIKSNQDNLSMAEATMRGLISGDTSSEVVRSQIIATHRKINFAQENISLWGTVLAEIKATTPQQDAVEKLENIDDLIAQYK